MIHCIEYRGEQSKATILLLKLRFHSLAEVETKVPISLMAMGGHVRGTSPVLTSNLLLDIGSNMLGLSDYHRSDPICSLSLLGFN